MCNVLSALLYASLADAVPVVVHSSWAVLRSNTKGRVVGSFTSYHPRGGTTTFGRIDTVECTEFKRDCIWLLASVGLIGAVEFGEGVTVIPSSTAFEVETFLDGWNKLVKSSFALDARRVAWGFFQFLTITSILREQ